MRIFSVHSYGIWITPHPDNGEVTRRLRQCKGYKTLRLSIGSKLDIPCWPMRLERASCNGQCRHGGYAQHLLLYESQKIPKFVVHIVVGCSLRNSTYVETPPLIFMHATDPIETFLQRNISGIDPAGEDGQKPEMQLCLQRFQKENFNSPLCRSPIAGAAVWILSGRCRY